MTPQLLPSTDTINDAPAYWFLGGLNILLARSESTGGSFSLIHHTAHPGHATPYHVHHVEDEAFYVLRGEFSFICDGKKTILGPGGYIFLPRRIPHGFRCTGTNESSVLEWVMPGTGFVGLMLEMAAPARSRTLPPPTTPDIGKLKALCEKYSIGLLGALPDS